MSNNTFTLDMFGNTALSTGLGIGVTGFAHANPIAANDDEPDPTPPTPARAMPIPSAATPTPKQGERSNCYLDLDGRRLAAGWKERAKANVAAILVAGEIEKQERPATLEEVVLGHLASGRRTRDGEAPRDGGPRMDGEAAA